MKQRKLDAIDRFADARILVLGDIMLDVYDFCHEHESKPIDSEKPGKRAYKSHQSVKAIGGAGNVGCNLAGLGAKASLIGVTGNDGHFFTMQQLCDEAKIDHFLLRDHSRPTTTKTRLYVDDDYLMRRDDECSDPVSHETAQNLLNEVVCRLENIDAVILSDYAKGVFNLELASGVIGACRERSVPVIVDFKPPNRDLFAGADLLVPNEVEADILLPGFRGSADLEASMRELRTGLECQNLAVTLGAKGICGLEGDQFFHVPGNEVTPVDAVGCGDTVRAGLALGQALGLDLEAAASLANDAAAVIVQKPATATLTCAELSAFISSR